MLAAEFPNDNPELHEGTIWVCLDVTGAPVAERHHRPAPLVVEIHPVIATLAEPILPSTVEPVVDAEPPVARESGIFMTFSSLKDEGELDELDELDEEGEILVEELAPLEDAILEDAILEAASEPPVVEEPAVIAPPPSDDPYVTFVSTLVDIAIGYSANGARELPSMLEGDAIARAWAGILRGTSEDWDAVGGSMLDEWAADTLARVTGADTQVLKRELRARGIAAFGLAA